MIKRMGKFDWCAVIEKQWCNLWKRQNVLSLQLALFFHCFAHVSNLIMKHAVLECFAIRNAIQWIHELGVLYQRSGKFKVSF